jgi:membrane-associated phospholipid phosphatase
LLSVSNSRLTITALVCLVATAALALAVAHNSSPYGFEDPALDWLGRPSSLRAWGDLTELLTAPAVFAGLVVALAVGMLKHATWRVLLYAVAAIAAFLISEHVAKPLVQRTYQGELTFPSGSVTAVCATVLAIWLALGPRLGRRAGNVVLAIGVAWVLLISLAVVSAHWHTPVDAVGSILLSVGIVTAGAAIFESAGARRFSTRVRRQFGTVRGRSRAGGVTREQP